jgi:signal transduction histidine kinase
MNEDLPLADRPVATHFAPPGRDTPEEFERKVSAIQSVPFLRPTLDAMPVMVVILNSNRQIVAANEALFKVLQATLPVVLQKRPGEAVGCCRAKDGPDGCGTALHCVTCGAVDAILESQKIAAQVVRECRILVAAPSGFEPLDLRVTATPLAVGADQFIVVAVEDISQAKRLAALQRTFFHDVLNTAGCIEGYAQCLALDPPGQRDICQRLTYLAQRLIDDIRAHRDLCYAESGDLKPQPELVRTRQLLEGLRSEYLKHPVAGERGIELGQVWDGTIATDRQLLHRVLGNMLKNALEAASRGETVTIGCSSEDDRVTFVVHNPGVMPSEVQLQVFQRSFSTKAQTGRGIGTYSMKLFGERYLGGTVTFTSRAPEGTSFRLSIPKNLPLT